MQSELTAALTAAGWKVEGHVIMLGARGTVFKHSIPQLQQLGLTREAVTQLLTDLHIHAVIALHAAVTLRRRLESGGHGSFDPG